MDFGDFPPLTRPVAFVSADLIVYRQSQLGMQILTGIRQDEPWKGTRTLSFGGYLDPADTNVITAAKREVGEETGLEVNCEFLVGIYGPERYHWTMGKSPSKPVLTDRPAHVLPVVAFVFAGRRTSGTLRESDEQRDLRWMSPSALVGQEVGFDHALALADFLNAFAGKLARFSAKSIR